MPIKITDEQKKDFTSIEEIENKYLEKFYHFLKYAEKEMLFGFHTKEKIEADWIGKYESSDFARGAERIVYALLNSKPFGQPNSSPVGSDLFFETEDAFIHIDLKTVQTRNIGDINDSIFVGTNQNSYTGDILVNGKKRKYKASLPNFYNPKGEEKKICLTYFITILYEEINLKILNINILCMPNGALYPIYGNKVLKAGKNPGKIRFRFSAVADFELLSDKKRVKVVYFDEASLSPKAKSRMSFLEEIYKEQKN